MSARPPDYVYFESTGGVYRPYGGYPYYVVQAMRYQALANYYSSRAPRRPQLRRFWYMRGRVGSARLLDKPYETIVSGGQRLVSWFTGRMEREKREGDRIGAFAYALGASATAFGTGVLAGITGLVSPRAWKETFQALRQPRETLESLKDPLSWSYLAGSIVGPAKAFKAAGSRLGRVVEPDIAVTEGGSLSLQAVKRGGGLKWVARLETEGPARPVGRGARPPPDRVVWVETSRGRAVVVEARKGNVVRRAFRADYGGKRVVGLEEWRIGGWLRPRYRYKGLIVDPMKAETVLAERPKGILKGVYSLPPPRVVVEPPLWRIGAGAGALLGLGSLPLSGPLSVPGLVAGRGQAPGESSSPLTSLTPAPAPASTALAVVLGSPRAIRALPPPPLGGALGGRGRRRRGLYSEIVYPAAILPLWRTNAPLKRGGLWLLGPG